MLRETEYIQTNKNFFKNRKMIRSRRILRKRSLPGLREKGKTEWQDLSEKKKKGERIKLLGTTDMAQ